MFDQYSYFSLSIPAEKQFQSIFHQAQGYRGGITDIRELKQARRGRQQKPHKLAYLTMKNSSFARFARAFFIF